MIIIKIAITCVVWLFTLPVFYIALTGGGPSRNIDIFFEHLSNLSHLSALPPNQLFEQFLFPLTVWIAILVLFAMNIGWLLNKKINRFIIYLGSFCGIANALLALSLTLWFGLGLLLIPGIWFAFYLVRWHLSTPSGIANIHFKQKNSG